MEDIREPEPRPWGEYIAQARIELCGALQKMVPGENASMVLKVAKALAELEGVGQ